MEGNYIDTKMIEATWERRKGLIGCECPVMNPVVCARRTLVVQGLIVEHGLECACDCHDLKKSFDL